jgi:hypothetical protein
MAWTHMAFRCMNMIDRQKERNLQRLEASCGLNELVNELLYEAVLLLRYSPDTLVFACKCK